MTKLHYLPLVAGFSLFMAAITIAFGAFVRLSDAGLSCPDWPTCYGRITWPQTHDQADQHSASAIRPLQRHKAWREQVHRFLAGLLGLAVLVLALLAVQAQHKIAMCIISACVLVAVAMALYIHQMFRLSAGLAFLAEVILLLSAVHALNTALSRIAIFCLMTVIFQALLGLWTVTWLLKPIVVMGHLLGAMLLFALLVWILWRALDRPIILAQAKHLRNWLGIGVVLLALQIALGGWVSANYAALACGGGSVSLDNFPRCGGQWWPNMQNYSQGFTLWRGIGVDYEGGVLDAASRIAIQITHRIMALLLASYLLFLAIKLARIAVLRRWALGLVVLLVIQLTLGILNVKLALPLPIAVLHNTGAVALLCVLVSLLARIGLPNIYPPKAHRL